MRSYSKREACTPDFIGRKTSKKRSPPSIRVHVNGLG